MFYLLEEAINPAHTQEEKVTHSCGYQKARTIESQFSGCLPQENSEIANMNRHSILNYVYQRKLGVRIH